MYTCVSGGNVDGIVADAGRHGVLLRGMVV